MYLLPVQGVMYIRQGELRKMKGNVNTYKGELRKMKGNVNTYSGMAVAAPAGEGSRFMPFWDVDFLKENLSNNLHTSKLFIFYILSLSSLSHI